MAWCDRAPNGVLSVQLDNGRRRRRAQRDDRPPRRSLPARPSGPPLHATSRARERPELPAAGGAPVEGSRRDRSGPQRGPPTRRLLLSARPPTDRAMWRRLLARVHPDAGGDDELFVWAKSLEELVRAKAQDVPAPPLGGTLQKEGRIPFDPHTDFDRISERALQFAPRAFGYGGILRIAGGAKRTGTAKDHRGATYEQLARIAYRLGIDKHQRNARKMWYRTARDVMLSEAHAEQIIGSLEDPNNP